MRFFFAALAAFLLAPSLSWAETQTATIDGARISYEVCGDQTAQGVVLLHDGLANAALWDEVWPALCKQYRVVRYDRRGYGKSPAAKASHFPTDDLLGVMKRAGLEHAHLIGASAGAGLAVDFVFDYPEAIDKLVLISPSISGFQPTKALIARLRRLEDTVVKGDIEATIGALNADPYIFADESDTAREKLAAILRASPGDLGAHPRQRRPLNVAARLSEIYAPTLVLVGSADDPYNQAVAATVQQKMRAATLQVVLGAGRLPYLEQPDTFVRLVTGFLK